MSPNTKKRKRQTTAAGGLQSRQTQVCLPVDLTDQLPSCALSCIYDFALHNYTPVDCPSTSNLDILCISRTATGLTIGEASLQCVASECANQATSELLLAAYRICEGVDNALPNTATVISATIRPVSTTPSPAPSPPVQPSLTTPTIPALPSATGPVMTGEGPKVVSVHGMSVTVDMTVPSSTTSSGSAPSMTEVGSSFMPEEMPKMDTGLSQGAVAGIAAGASLAALLGLALLFLFLRKRRHAKEDKTVWPKQISSPDTATSQISSFGPARPKQFPQSKRRSFWRMSIMPSEIGVAISGRFSPGQSSPSAQDMLGQMPRTTSSARPSWPAPPIANGLAPPRPARDSVSTIFDDDIEQQTNGPPRVSVGGAYFSLADTGNSRRQRTTPQPLELSQARAMSPLVESSVSPGDSATLPLTPTYDNGNFVATPTRSIAPNSIDAALASTIPLAIQSQVALQSTQSHSTNLSPHRNRLQKKPSLSRPPAAALPMRQDSESTAFDTDTTPGEVDRRPELQDVRNMDAVIQGPRSPINNLRYPAVPESAAVSSQARQPAQPRYLLGSPISSFLPKGIRNGSNSLMTDSISSDGRGSDYSLDWPVPPSGRPSMANPTPVSPLARLAYRATAEGKYSLQRASENQLSPNSQARITPTKSKTGDLFFKVEMQ